MMHRLVFCDPGHFHAALVLRARNPRVHPQIHLYAEPGPERQAFLDLVSGFNARAAEPTDWRLEVHDGPDPLDRLIAERHGDLVVLAGRNAPKLGIIRRLHENGFHVLADKPWITTSASLGDLERVTGGPPIAMDIMTERHDALARLRQRIVSTPSVFGVLAGESAEAPAIELGSIHHLCKQVDGRPLQRPEWYYDVVIQGDGLVDIQSHMTDQAQWLIGEDEHDLVIDDARRWFTEVPLAVYRESTGDAAFPDALAPEVSDGALHLACNGLIDYRLAGLRVRQRAEWRLRTPEGGGDAHTSIVRGTKARVVLRKGPETGHAAEIHIGADDPSALQRSLAPALDDWRREFLGLTSTPSDLGVQLLVPPGLQPSHVEHFPMVLETFLDHVESGAWPSRLASQIGTRYSLLAKARDVALTSHRT